MALITNALNSATMGAGELADNSQNKDRYLQPVFEKVDRVNDIVYGEVRNYLGKKEMLHLDIYSPSGDRETDRPVMIWIHGGGFADKPGCDKKQSYIVTLCNDFAKRGYVCISIDYRVRQFPEIDLYGTIDDAVTDAKNAVKWIRENSQKYHYNSDQTIIGGGSAGGSIAKSLCYTAWDKQGIIGLVNLWGVEAMVNIKKEDPPAISIHGTADEMVPYKTSEIFAQTLTGQGVSNLLYPLEGAEHTPVQHMNEIEAKIGNFLVKILSGK